MLGCSGWKMACLGEGASSLAAPELQAPAVTSASRFQLAGLTDSCLGRSQDPVLWLVVARSHVTSRVASPKRDRVCRQIGAPPNSFHIFKFGDFTSLEASPHHFQDSPSPDSPRNPVTMSAKTEPASKKFGSGSRTVPHHSQKASKWYPAEDVAVKKKVSGCPRNPIYHRDRTPGASGRRIGLNAAAGSFAAAEGLLSRGPRAWATARRDRRCGSLFTSAWGNGRGRALRKGHRGVDLY